MGARLVEMDVYDGKDGHPKIYHGGTFTSKLNFEDALKAIKEYAFKRTEYVFCFVLVKLNMTSFKTLICNLK